jgi:hypothetical protein
LFVKFAFAFSLLALLISRATAAVLLNEPFAYTNGPLTLVSSGAWDQHSGSTPEQVDVAAGKVNLTSGETEDVNRLLSGQPYSSGGSTNLFYARFTLRVTGLPTAGGAWFVGFKNSSTTIRARVFTLTSGAPSGKFRLGLSTANNDDATVTNVTDLTLNTAYNVVLKLANTNSKATLWINPASEADPFITTTESSSTFTVVSFALRQDGNIGSLALDDLVVATTFNEVLSGSPAGAPFITSLRGIRKARASMKARRSHFPRRPMAQRWLTNGFLMARQFPRPRTLPSP